MTFENRTLLNYQDLGSTYITSYYRLRPGTMGESYEKFLNRITELELDLSQTVSANSRLLEDLENLRELHEEIVVAYGRLKSQHASAKTALHDERNRHEQLEQQHAEQLNLWHEKMLAKVLS